MRRGYGYALLAVFFWSTVATAFKLALRNLHFEVLLFYSSISSCLILLLLVVLRSDPRTMIALLRKHWRRSVLCGLINPFGYYLILFKAYSLLPAQMAQPLNYTWPLVLVVMSAIIFKEPVHLRNYAGIVLSFCGVIVIATRGQVTSLNIEEPFGVFLAIISSSLWAAYWLLMYRDECDPLFRMFCNFLFGSIFIGILVGVQGLDLSVSPSDLMLCLYIGAFEMGITFVFWLRAMQVSKSTLIAHLVFLAPFISLLFIRFILKEVIFLSSIVGLALIIGGILVGQRKSDTDQHDTHED